MIGFLSTFTDSFLLALLIWPFLAMFLTLPIVIVQYRVYNRLSIRRSLAIYFFILFVLGLIAFTLYPLPDNSAEFCANHSLYPQLNLLQFVFDFQKDGMSVILQLVMNFVLFLPFGVFAKLLFRWRFVTTLVVCFLSSVLVEVAQLTGVFGLYPCSYRLFDVDDILLNTMGGIAGYALACLAPQSADKKAKSDEYVNKPGLFRNIVAFILDQMLATVSSMVIVLLMYFIFGGQVAGLIERAITVIMVFVFHVLIPFVFKGGSVGGWFVRLNHDDHKRSSADRALYYFARAIIVFLILFPPYYDWLSWLTIVAILIIWWKSRKLPYQLLP